MSVGRHSSRERERYPRLREDIGEDPARYLDVPMFREGGGTTPLMTAFSRIRGIDSLEVLNAWLAVERRLDRGPRQRVVEAIEERREFLAEHGERPAELPADDSAPGRYQERELQHRDIEYRWVDRENNERTPVAGANLGET